MLTLYSCVFAGLEPLASSLVRGGGEIAARDVLISRAGNGGRARPPRDREKCERFSFAIVCEEVCERA